MKIVNHKLVATSTNEKVTLDSTNNKGGNIDPSFIIIHFTAGRTAESSVSWFKNPKAKASAHFVIGRDGKVYQIIDCNVKAWHAGVSRWADIDGFNDKSIGIELANPGRLTKVGDKYISWFKQEYEKENIVEVAHKHEKKASFWYDYAEAQIDACFEVCRAIMDEYNIKNILGHDDIAPYRKNDPGPLFPMESFRAKLFGRDDDTGDIYKTITNNVNIRRGPGKEYESLGQIHKDAKVEFMQSNNGWFQVYILSKANNMEELKYGWIYGELLEKK